MTPPAASDTGADRRTVGDILLARGYISEAQLEHAVASQQASGKPLGQVLVEAGAITRLELASALAEQWSDTATWLGPPAEGKTRGGGRSRRSDDALNAEAREAGYAQQLQEAVVELARRVASFEPVLTDLRLRIESGETDGAQHVLDRVEVVQEGVGVVSRRLDELTEGIERALTSIEQSSNELAGEIDALGDRVDASAAVSALDDLRARVEELADRSSADPGLGSALDTLARRVEQLEERTAQTAEGRLDDIRSAVDALRAELAGRAEAAAIDELRTGLETLRETVAGLAERPQADPELAARLEELTARIEALAGTDALEAVQAAVEEIAGRPQADPELAARLEELTARIEALAGTDALEAVQAAVEEIAGRPTADPELKDRLEALASRVEAAFAAVEERAPSEAVAGLHTRLDELAERLGALAAGDDLAALRSEVTDLAARVAAIDVASSAREHAPLDPDAERRLDHVVSRLDALHARVEEVANAGEGEDAGSAVVDELRAEIQRLADRPAGDPELSRTVDAIAARLEDLSSAAEARAGEEAAIRGALAELAGTKESVAAVAERLERIESAQIAHATGHSGDDQAALREELASQIAEVARQATGAVDAWSADRSTLEARLDALAAEVGEVKLLVAQAPAAAPAAVAPTSRAKARPAASDEPARMDGELERLRMAVERINMHLGERERAIADLMRSRAQEVKLEELVARISELEQGGGAPATPTDAAPAGGGEVHAELRSLAQRLEESEKAAKADRDKVLTQLERMASSIDWRFRRLESGEEDAA